eukprot:GHVP01012065.1.p1 GENE.GHVP01012065.1~~GHVP01012065.1.p1  ORF type:complete len:170 (+),score=35.08 GHVP01012065.1:538-1047(+)
MSPLLLNITKTVSKDFKLSAGPHDQNHFLWNLQSGSPKAKLYLVWFDMKDSDFFEGNFFKAPFSKSLNWQEMEKNAALYPTVESNIGNLTSFADNEGKISETNSGHGRLFNSCCISRSDSSLEMKKWIKELETLQQERYSYLQKLKEIEEKKLKDHEKRKMDHGIHVYL